MQHNESTQVILTNKQKI